MGAKIASLNSELDELREKTSDLPFWNSLLWEDRTVTVGDWALVDAWYRSRCLELPSIGDAMVPSVDMVNHSNEPDAYYDEDSEGDVEILLRPGFTVESGDEVTISYGEFKSAAEMLFSYGFIDRNTSKDEMTLALDSFPDDPLAQAKLHIFDQFPTVRLSRTEGTLKWESPYLHLMVLNEEDGLEFRVLQDMDGGRQLKLFWQDDDVTSRATDFEALTQNHPLCPLFRLRSVTVLAEQITSQLGRIRETPTSEEPGQPVSPELKDACIQAAGMLKEIEISLLEATVATLEEQVRQSYPCPPHPQPKLPFTASTTRQSEAKNSGDKIFPWIAPATFCSSISWITPSCLLLEHVTDQGCYSSSKQPCLPTTQ